MKLPFLSPKIEGSIGYHGLTKWWLSTFTDEERDRIEDLYHPMGVSNPRPLTQGKVISASESPSLLLVWLATWLRSPKDRDLARRVAIHANRLVNESDDVIGAHFAYQAMIEVFYKERDTDPGALDTAIEACEKQIALAPKAAKAFKKEYAGQPLPRPIGYTQLAIIREKQGDPEEAIRLAKAAKRQGWAGDWEKRIARLEVKLAKKSEST